LLRLLTDVDDIRRIALVAELDVDGGDAVAFGNVCALDDDRAELGLVVADAWQRQGIGIALASRVLHAAETHGYHRFVVHGLLGNPALRPLLRHVGDIVSATTRADVTEIAFVRRRPAEALTRAFRCVADGTQELRAITCARPESCR